MSAILKITKSIDNDIWKIAFSIDPLKFSESDKQLIAKFGEPEINVGGVFLDNDPKEYTLPNKFIKIRSGLPYTQEFDSRGAPFDTNTQIKADAYLDVFVDRYTDALTALRANQDSFSGEYLINI